MTHLQSSDQELPRKLHEWYLEATTSLKPESYNPNAQKPYDDMSDEQKYIDKYIADKLLAWRDAHTKAIVEQVKARQKWIDLTHDQLLTLMNEQKTRAIKEYDHKLGLEYLETGTNSNIEFWRAKLNPIDKEN